MSLILRLQHKNKCSVKGFFEIGRKNVKTFTKGEKGKKIAFVRRKRPHSVRYPTAHSRGVSAKLRFFILSFCRSVKESIKESAFERRQKLPAGTGAAPLCQPLKCGADYRDVTAALKMKHSRRFRGERLPFSAVAVIFPLRRRREEGVCSHIISPNLI